MYIYIPNLALHHGYRLAILKGKIVKQMMLEDTVAKKQLYFFVFFKNPPA